MFLLTETKFSKQNKLLQWIGSFTWFISIGLRFHWFSFRFVCVCVYDIPCTYVYPCAFVRLCAHFSCKCLGWHCLLTDKWWLDSFCIYQQKLNRKKHLGKWTMKKMLCELNRRMRISINSTLVLLMFIWKVHIRKCAFFSLLPITLMNQRHSSDLIIEIHFLLQQCEIDFLLILQFNGNYLSLMYIDKWELESF